MRAVFAMFEGVGYATRQYILAQAAAGQYQISTQERDLLTEQTFVLDGKGNIKTKESFLQFLPGFRLTINIWGGALVGRSMLIMFSDTIPMEASKMVLQSETGLHTPS